MLADYEIRELLPTLANPFDTSLIQPASLEVRLGGEHVLAWDKRGYYGEVLRGEFPLPYNLKPFQPVVLATTQETITLPPDIGAQFNGKSTLARMGLMTHVTAGFIDPGFSGQITLELVNFGGRSICLTPGMKIGQLHFFRMNGPAEKPYGEAGNHYQGQVGPTPARFSKGDYGV